MYDAETIRSRVPYKRVGRENLKQFITFAKLARGRVELIPNAILVSLWSLVGLSTVWYAARRFEVWIDRTDKSKWRLPPWDWQRCRRNYWKLPIVRFDWSGGLAHRRLPDEYSKLQNEMIDAAVARGTRMLDEKAAPAV